MIASWLVGVTTMSTLGLPYIWALAATGLFATHPIHTENLCYHVCRADILGVVAGLLATLAYSRYFGCFSWEAARLSLWAEIRGMAGMDGEKKPAGVTDKEGTRGQWEF